mmetsp:Transcript_28076/g.82602  ORF Transcript_28076/g.82602 Transcript_28076/m.82602 type:complete len:531 (-) Transcript_28076:592-2184(-)
MVPFEAAAPIATTSLAAVPFIAARAVPVPSPSGVPACSSPVTVSVPLSVAVPIAIDVPAPAAGFIPSSIGPAVAPATTAAVCSPASVPVTIIPSSVASVPVSAAVTFAIALFAVTLPPSGRPVAISISVAVPIAVASPAVAIFVPVAITISVTVPIPFTIAVSISFPVTVSLPISVPFPFAATAAPRRSPATAAVPFPIAVPVMIAISIVPAPPDIAVTVSVVPATVTPAVVAAVITVTATTAPSSIRAVVGVVEWRLSTRGGCVVSVAPAASASPSPSSFVVPTRRRHDAAVSAPGAVVVVPSLLVMLWHLATAAAVRGVIATVWISDSPAPRSAIRASATVGPFLARPPSVSAPSVQGGPVTSTTARAPPPFVTLELRGHPSSTRTCLVLPSRGGFELDTAREGGATTGTGADLLLRGTNASNRSHIHRGRPRLPLPALVDVLGTPLPDESVVGSTGSDGATAMEQRVNAIVHRTAQGGGQGVVPRPRRRRHDAPSLGGYVTTLRDFSIDQRRRHGDRAVRSDRRAEE